VPLWTMTGEVQLEALAAPWEFPLSQWTRELSDGGSCFLRFFEVGSKAYRARGGIRDPLWICHASCRPHGCGGSRVGVVLPCASVKPRRKLIGWRGYSARPHRLVNDKRHSVSCRACLSSPAPQTAASSTQAPLFPICAESNPKRDQRLASELLQLLA